MSTGLTGPSQGMASECRLRGPPRAVPGIIPPPLHRTLYRRVRRCSLCGPDGLPEHLCRSREAREPRRYSLRNQGRGLEKLEVSEQ